MLRVNDPPPLFGANRIAWARPKLPEDKRRANILVPSFSGLSFSSLQRDAARRDAMLYVCIRKTKRRCTRTNGRQDAQRIFAGRRRVLLSQTVPSLLYIFSSSRLLTTPLHPLSSRRTASPFYPLSFILYPLYPGLPRQADASAPNGIMHRELVSYRLAVCVSFFPLVPNCATHGSFFLLRIYVCMCFPSLFHLLRSCPSSPPRLPVPLPSSLPLAPCGVPDKKSLDRHLCAPQTQSPLFFPHHDPSILSFFFPSAGI